MLEGVRVRDSNWKIEEIKTWRKTETMRLVTIVVLWAKRVRRMHLINGRTGGMIKMIEFGVFAAINYDSRQHTGRNHYQINIIDFAV